MTSPLPGTEALANDFAQADAYERLMGRWSRRLAPLLIRFGGVADDEHVLDVGCGTGSLAFALPGLARVAAITGIDTTETFVAAATARNADPRIRFEVGDAQALPYGDATFDRAFSCLALHFIPDAARAVAELRRVVRPRGRVAAAVWDSYGGQTFTRILWDVASVLDPAVVQPLFPPMTGPGEMAQAFRVAGLEEVEETNLVIRMEFTDFDDFWAPFATGEGPHGKYVVGLPTAARDQLRQHVRRAFLGGRPDGRRSMAAVAWACRGVVPGT